MCHPVPDGTVHFYVKSCLFVCCWVLVLFVVVVVCMHRLSPFLISLIGSDVCVFIYLFVLTLEKVEESSIRVLGAF